MKNLLEIKIKFNDLKIEANALKKEFGWGWENPDYRHEFDFIVSEDKYDILQAKIAELNWVLNN